MAINPLLLNPQDPTKQLSEADKTDPFSGGNIQMPDGSELSERLNQPNYQANFKKYQDRLSPYLYQAPKLDFFDMASELGAAILSTPSTGNVFEGIGRGFSNISTRVRQAREDNMKANQQMGMQVASLAMQDEQRAQDYMDKYSLELLKLANDPGDLVTLEFDEYIPEVGADGNPVFETDADGSHVLGADGQPIQKQVASGKRLQRCFRDNFTNQRAINTLLRRRNAVKINSPESIINLGGEGDKEWVKAQIAEMDMFLAGSPSLASTYNGFMKQLEYLDRIADRSEQLSVAYSEEALKLEEQDMSPSQMRRQLNLFKREWRKENPLFESAEEIAEIEGHAAGQGYGKDYNYQSGRQSYRSSQTAKKLPANTQSVAEQSSSLADKVVKGSGAREEKTIQLQDMIDKGLPVPEWMIQAYELTPKSD